jgi:hypothetical protein
MHRALRIPEILRMILLHLSDNKKNLVSSVAVSKTLNAAAVPVLWESIDILPLLKLLPSDVVKLDRCAAGCHAIVV